MSKKNPTMEDIAKKLNISKYAVSLALSNKKGVSEETRKRVIRTANLMGYKNTRAKARETNNIAVMISNKALKDPYFFSVILNGIEKEAKRCGYAVNIMSINKKYDNINSISDFIFKNDIDGVIIVSDIGDDLILQIKEYVPMVILDHYIEDADIDCIMTENYQGVSMAIKHLVEVANATNIGFIGDIGLAVSYDERWLAFQDIMYRLGLKIDMDLCKIDGFEDFAENPEKDIEEFIDGIKYLPEAFFCVSDLSAVALNNILNKKRIHVPEDVSIIGFDDTKLAQMSIPPLTMVHVFKEYYGNRAVEQLILNIEHGHKHGELIRIKTKLISRDSVKLVNSSSLASNQEYCISDISINL